MPGSVIRCRGEDGSGSSFLRSREGREADRNLGASGGSRASEERFGDGQSRRQDGSDPDQEYHRIAPLGARIQLPDGPWQGGEPCVAGTGDGGGGHGRSPSASGPSVSTGK